MQLQLPLIASPARRFAAAAIDLSIATAIATVAELAIGEYIELFIAICFLYQGVCLHASRGRSPGRVAMGIEVRDAVTYGPLSPKQAWCRSAVRPSILTLSILVAFSLPSRLLSVEGSITLVIFLTVGIDAGLLLASRTRQVLSEKMTGTVTVFSGLPATQSAQAIA